MLTGQYPHTAGMLGLAHRGFKIADPSHHLAAYLRSCGYTTALCGIQHETTPEEIDYDHIFIRKPAGEMGHRGILDDRATVKYAAEFLHTRRHGDKPFFLSVGFRNTHRPYPHAADDIDPEKITLPSGIADTLPIRNETAGFVTAIEEVDKNVGAVISALESEKLADDTLIMFTTDHGIAYPRHKCTLYDGGIGVALIFKGASLPRGRTVDALVSQIDVFPTLCELLNVPSPEWLQGVSAVGLLKGETEKIREACFAEVNYHAAYEPIRCVRTDRYKYIRHFGDRALPVVCNIDDGEAKTYALEHGFADIPLPKEELYDLKLDFTECENLVNDPAYEEVLADMRLRLEKWRKNTGDVLPENGDIPLPKGARVNSRDAISPNEKLQDHN